MGVTKQNFKKLLDKLEDNKIYLIKIIDAGSLLPVRLERRNNIFIIYNLFNNKERFLYTKKEIEKKFSL